MTERRNTGPTSVDPQGEFPFGAADYVLHLLAAIHQFRDAALDARLKAVGLNVGRYRVLGVLNRFGACTMTELSHFTAIDRTTLTRIADQLVANDQVERQTTARDRRQVLLALTPSGRKVYIAALGVVFEFNRRILEGIPEKAHRATARVLKQVVGNLAPDAAARDSIIHFSREAPPAAQRPSAKAVASRQHAKPPAS
jgi:MarR family transcriptional regulator, lower aerobic nicotinate degradation pathway regulator